jgi:type II secretory pathway pseudopilin PulG
MQSFRQIPSARRGFSLVEVTLAIGIVGVAILSLVGILGSTFQQVDDIMQTNRALSGVTRLVAALDNPRSIIVHQSGDTTGVTNNNEYLHQASTLFTPPLDPNATTQPASNFDLVYRLLCNAKDNSTANAVWLYVYERKVVSATSDFNGTAYALSANPSVMEVATAKRNGDNFTALGASARNVVGTPMRVRLSLSKLLNGQRFQINATTGEPDVARFVPGTSSLPTDPNLYPLAYLPVVAEFFPHDYVDATVFKDNSVTPLLVQNIVISR